ncbi:hypothetical protein QWJ34_03895 [Saccharibacillus sp. CPCC 101409]|uniref:hypothetical protein n=1 Tax=Saccharibacillus sp. CPCC 101409 TaxID=3058041 RepID=UPI002671B45D|nr:hypothetical protein [Saccharibacillus sp. CPCC 101409]MDO3408902.1 hypothetical protein [Saccharibacillus sp. CPCC 101409]
MKLNRKMIALTTALSLAVPLAAASPGLSPNTAAAADSHIGAFAKAGAAAKSGSVRPATKYFQLTIKGKNATRKAQLKTGDTYSLYAASGYTFSSAKNKLYLTSYPKYSAQIQPLPSNYDLNALRKKGTAELKQYGKVNSYSGDQLFESPMSGALLYLQTSDEKGIRDYVVWKAEDGKSYLFRVSIPESDFAGTFRQIVYTSLSTIASK